MSRRSASRGTIAAVALGLCAAGACGVLGLGGGGGWPAALGPGTRVAVVEGGLASPESVRYDPEQDVWFVTNFNTGAGNARDNNGFITRLGADGAVQQLKFVEGGRNGATLHAPKGMFIVGDTLWAADLDALRGYHRETGAPVANVDLTGLGANTPNDVTQGPDGALYVTDTGLGRIYRVEGRSARLALQDTALNRPNGIAWDRYGSRFLVVPIGGKLEIHGWRPGQAAHEVVATSPRGAFDGVEVIGPDRWLVTSQNDSSLQVVSGGRGQRLIPLTGRPADLGVDPRRNRVAIPFLAQNRVEIWQLNR
jgi:sugar lactone lactonase YvrE